MYAKIKNGQLVQFPYGHGELQADNPYTNFDGLGLYQAFQGTESNLDGNTLEVVTQDPRPEYDSKTHTIAPDSTPVLRDNQWILGWTVTAKTAEELAQQDAQKASSVRAERNAKLTASDWTQVADAPVDKAAWAAYRQALRDITAQAGFPWDVQWPSQPD